MSKNRNRNRNRSYGQNPRNTNNNILTVTHRGFTAKIDRRLLADYEVIMMLSEVEETENPLVVPRIMKTILGEKQHQAMIDHYRGPEGRVDMEHVAGLFQKIGETSPKN